MRARTDSLHLAVYRRLLNEGPRAHDVNEITYGNPPMEFAQLARQPHDPIKSWFIQHGEFDSLVAAAPANDSPTTKQDLQHLLELTRTASREDVAFARFVDDETHIAGLFLRLLGTAGYTESMDDYFRVDNQTDGLLFHLKEVVNRPRPYQLAQHYGLPIFPLILTDAMTASYPNGHALVGFVMSEHYARRYPALAGPLRELGAKIAASREVVGLHYPSDTEASRRIAQVIFQHDLLV